MTMVFRTQVYYSPPSPLGLLAGRWVVDHHCTVCRARVDTAELISHAQMHAAVALDVEDDELVP